MFLLAFQLKIISKIAAVENTPLNHKINFCNLNKHNAPPVLCEDKLF